MVVRDKRHLVPYHHNHLNHPSHYLLILIPITLIIIQHHLVKVVVMPLLLSSLLNHQPLHMWHPLSNSLWRQEQQEEEEEVLLTPPTSLCPYHHKHSHSLSLLGCGDPHLLMVVYHYYPHGWHLLLILMGDHGIMSLTLMVRW